LDDTSRERALDDAKTCRASRGDRSVEVRVIEDIKEFEPEIESLALGNMKAFH
jgi:hypothetical protein